MKEVYFNNKYSDSANGDRITQRELLSFRYPFFTFWHLQFFAFSQFSACSFNSFRELSRLLKQPPKPMIRRFCSLPALPLSQDAAKAKKKPTERALHKVRIKSHELSRGSARSASAADLRVRRSNAPGMAAGWLELPIQPILTVTEII